MAFSDCLAESDYDPFLNFVTLSVSDRRQCFNLSIIADSVAEHTENLTVVLEHVAQATPRTVIITPDKATVFISKLFTLVTVKSIYQYYTHCFIAYLIHIFLSDSDECREGSHDCDENAECSDTLEGFDCTCLPGFTGDGRTCVGGLAHQSYNICEFCYYTHHSMHCVQILMSAMMELTTVILTYSAVWEPAGDWCVEQLLSVPTLKAVMSATVWLDTLEMDVLAQVVIQKGEYFCFLY